MKQYSGWDAYLEWERQQIAIQLRISKICAWVFIPLSLAVMVGVPLWAFMVLGE